MDDLRSNRRALLTGRPQGAASQAGAASEGGGGGGGRTYAQAWRAYLDALEQCRATVEADPVCADVGVRDAGLYLPTQLQAAAFYMQLAPNTSYPLLNRTHVGEPIGLNWGMPNPDFDYRWAYLDGKRRYRIHGPRKSKAAFFDLIAFNGYFIDNTKTYFQGALNQFETPDGGIELFLGPPSKGPNHITLDPDEPHNVLTLREALEDWSTQQPTPLRIECVDAPETLGPFNYPEADLVARLDRAAVLIRNSAKRTMTFFKDIQASAGGQSNVFAMLGNTPERKKNNGHPDNQVCASVFHIPRGQSLIVELEMPRTVEYWGLQTADLWWRTTDFIWRQSSLNRSDSHFGKDGVFRAVASHEDPGIQNWIDLVDNERGVLSIRNYRASNVNIPRVQLVPSGQVRGLLPADVPVFTPEQRRAQIAARTDAVLRRFGY